jgi:hypothetical protein
MTKSAPGDVVPFPARSGNPTPEKRDTRAASVTRKNLKKPKETLGFRDVVSRIHASVVTPCHAPRERDEGGIAAFRAREARTSEAELRLKYPREAETFRRILADHRAGKCDLCPDWQAFKNFILALGPMGPAPRTLDRIDNDDPEYGPGKVRWASATEQARNRSTTTTLRGPDGTVRPLTEWAKRTGQNPATMRQRRKRGWRDEEIVAGKRDVPTAPSGGTAEDDPWHRQGWPKGVTPAKWNPAFVAFRAMGRRTRDEEAIIPRELRAGLTRPVLLAYLVPRIIGRIHDLTLENFPELENPDPEAMPALEALAAFKPYAALPRFEAILDDALMKIGDDPVQRKLLRMLQDRKTCELHRQFAYAVGPYLPDVCRR